MSGDQQAIFYILGDNRSSVAHSPHLDYFRTHDVEVLYLLDPLDGFVMQALKEYQGTPFGNVDDPSLELPGAEQEAEGEARAEDGVTQAGFDQWISRFVDVLGERVTEVRESKHLTDSPCRLISPEGGPERELQRVRRLLERDFETPAKILEINRRHPLIQNLAHLTATDPDADVIDAAVEQLFENLLLLEGLHPNPAHMVPRIQALLEAATRTEHRTQ
jgi:molecular chaperone HtpG